MQIALAGDDDRARGEAGHRGCNGRQRGSCIHYIRAIREIRLRTRDALLADHLVPGDGEIRRVDLAETRWGCQQG